MIALGAPTGKNSTQTKEFFCVARKDVELILLADLRRFDLFESRAMFIARRIGVKQAAKNQPMRAHRLDKLFDVPGAAYVRRVEENVACTLGDIERELAIGIGGQCVHRDKTQLGKFQRESLQTPHGFEVRFGIGMNQRHQTKLSDLLEQWAHQLMIDGQTLKAVMPNDAG